MMYWMTTQNLEIPEKNGRPIFLAHDLDNIFCRFYLFSSKEISGTGKYYERLSSFCLIEKVANARGPFGVNQKSGFILTMSGPYEIWALPG